MRLSKSLTMTQEEIEVFLKKYLTKYIEGKMEEKVVSIELHEDGAHIELEGEDLTNE